MTEAQNDDWAHCFPDHVRSTIIRLRADARMTPLWRSGFSEADLRSIADNLEVAMYDGPWDRKTNRERRLWQKKFDKAVAELLDLMKDAPTPPEHWGFPVRDYALMAAAKRMGVAIPPQSDIDAFFGAMIRLECAVDDMQWTLADSLKHYTRQQNTDAGPAQIISKPRDEKALRAKFIVLLRKYTKFTVQQIATIAAATFNDDAIDDRLVRRLSTDRVDL